MFDPAHIAALLCGHRTPPIPGTAGRAPLVRMAALLAGLVAGTAAGATTCEALRADIEARIAAAGVTRFVVAVVDADAPAPGRVVGSCDLGRRKIVYQVEAGTEPARPTVPMLTECRDGSVSLGGDCRR